jgi:hypothetical protein
MKRVILTCISTTLLLTSTVKAELNFDKVPQRLSAYYLSKMQSVQSIKKKLTAKGFNVLATDTILKGKTVITFTNKELQATNSYLSTLHLMVNKDDAEIRVQNPSYFASAYLKDYQYGDFKITLNRLEEVLTYMVPLPQKKDKRVLPRYHFMFGMPYLKDTITVSNNVTSFPKSISYSLQLPNGSVLIGHKLSTKTTHFLEKIGQSKNAQLLPYESIIQNGHATILDPKYYLPLSLPNLRMGQFMKIATTPYNITKEIEKSYK